MKKYPVDNAIIMAAGLSSRFAPISYEYPKALVTVKGEVLIERQIRQLKAAGIDDITVVVGYKKELFAYLADQFQVKLIENPEYDTRNNHASLYYARHELKNTYICSADNYFSENVFENAVAHAYYSAVYVAGPTDEWCLKTNAADLITDVTVGGSDAWVMLGHVFFSEDFSSRFVAILEAEYDLPQTKDLLWEDIYQAHLAELPMYMKRYEAGVVFEFDSLDELRAFDTTYLCDTRSKILQQIARDLDCTEADLAQIEPIKANGATIGFYFVSPSGEYEYLYETKTLARRIYPADQVEIVRLSQQLFPTADLDTLQIKRLGGLTNRNYLVQLGESQYVYRLAGEGTAELIKRTDEEACNRLAQEIGITADLIYFDGTTGTKVTAYVEDAQTMNPTLVKAAENLQAVAQTFQTLHQAEVESTVVFDVFEKIEEYEQLIPSDLLWADYESIKRQILRLETKLAQAEVAQVLCHNDPLCENFIRGAAGMVLVDWEYAGMNNALWDVADFIIEAELSSDEEALFCAYYFGEEPTATAQQGVLIHKALIDFLWSLWGLQRTSCGANLLDYATKRYENSKAYLHTLQVSEKN